MRPRSNTNVDELESLIRVEEYRRGDFRYSWRKNELKHRKLSGLLQVALVGPVAGAPLEAGPFQIPEGSEGAIDRPEVVPEGSRNIRVGHVGLLAVVGRVTEFRPFLPAPVVHHLARAHGVVTVVTVVPEVRHQGAGRGRSGNWPARGCRWGCCSGPG